MTAYEKCKQAYRYHCIEFQVQPILKYPTKGRAKPDAQKLLVGYKVESVITRDESAITEYLNRKGRFILATNCLDKESLPDITLFNAYKEQQGVERGFRFLKDPWFMVDSFFVKKHERLEALMMIMTLSLLVYNYTQHKLREALKKTDETLPNQQGKPTQTPTMRWIFQLMEGIAIVKLFDQAKHTYRSIITNLNEVRIKIIRLLGKTTCLIYGIQMEIAGM